MNIDRFELRDQGDGILRFQGHAVVFGAKYEIGPWTEEVRKGAFTRTRFVPSSTGRPIWVDPRPDKRRWRG